MRVALGFQSVIKSLYPELSTEVVGNLIYSYIFQFIPAKTAKSTTYLASFINAISDIDLLVHHFHAKHFRNVKNQPLLLTL